MDVLFVSLLLIVICQGFFIFKLRKLARKDKAFYFNNRLFEIPHRQRIFETNPTLYRDFYQERLWDELDKEIDRQIRTGKEIDIDVLRNVFLKQTVS